ncbi:unnamed protein product (macronuclear) [Paramecium tetraurelia]|uniref:Transmembrane protein n=1 Tax=Paramecium tetraurelia TaxID=5888 RepID=A0EFN0_PARTE|nr:uncharacterized protein GSPATT00026444001 [Paramecium tetraurelia]CAK94121.1 unnamed protein product [Paramecium tetraurelia]|eukprot:XP_001461494.1 hypothetical protein (macronuclear) [Paramecium tetraurelia strain d4-2]
MIFESYLNNSSMISILNNQPQEGILIGDDFTMRNTSWVNSNLINRTVQIRTSLNNGHIYSNLLENSSIISISSKISLSQITISETSPLFSQFLSIKQITQSSKFRCNITNLDAINNDLSSSNIILIFSSLQTNSIQIYLINFSIKHNNSNVLVQIVLIIVLEKFQYILNNVTISRILNVDESIVQISPSQQSFSFLYSIIDITNLQFIENTLIQSTLFDLYHAQLQNLITRLTQICIIFHMLKTFSTLIQVVQQAPQCVLYPYYIKNLLYENNALTNTSNSLMIIRSDTLMMNNFTLNNLNFQELWINHYDIQFNGELNQDSLNDFVFEALQVKNNGGGAGQFLVSNITCINCSFSNILVIDCFILDIITKSDGNINFMNIKVN